jgi:2-(1,2-epoxy-1,2-dihydrophenyl)acetyl-CoA isomerase
MEQANGPRIAVERRGRIGRIVLGNSVGVHMIDEQFPAQLEHAIDDLVSTDGIRAVILTGSTKVFCAGADLSLVDRLREPEFGTRWLRSQHDALRSLAEFPRPTVAAVNGAAFGAGFNLALACDFLVASEDASFSQAFVRVGLATDMGSPYLLPRRIGIQRARELMYTGRTLSVAEALEIGVVDELVPPDRLAERAEDHAGRLAAGPPLALAAMKRAPAAAPWSSLHEALDREMELQIPILGSDDFHEGATAFLEKRAPEFTGS